MKEIVFINVKSKLLNIYKHTNNMDIIDQIFYEEILLKILRSKDLKKFWKKSKKQINFRQKKSLYHILQVHQTFCKEICLKM